MEMRFPSMICGSDFQSVMVKFYGWQECSTRFLRRTKEIRNDIVVFDELYPSFCSISMDDLWWWELYSGKFNRSFMFCVIERLSLSSTMYLNFLASTRGCRTIVLSSKEQKSLIYKLLCSLFFFWFSLFLF